MIYTLIENWTKPLNNAISICEDTVLNTYVLGTKEGCNWWHGLSAAIKLGTPVHSDAFWSFLFHWGLDKPLLKIQGGHIK